MEGMDNKVWYRCTRCRHSTMFDTDTLKLPQNVIKVSREDCTSYSPDRIYNVGELIYHADWDDMGKVTQKVTTSDGGHAIVVSFEKSGSRRLVEDLHPEI
jgi:hypothetical protein